VPSEDGTWLQHSRELGHDASVVGGIEKESKGCEEIDHRIKAVRPPLGKPPHVAARVAKGVPFTASPSAVEQRCRIVEAVDVEPRLGEEVRVASLAARNIQNPCPDRKLEDLDETPDFTSIALGREERFVFEEVVGVEVRRPPVVRCGQKNTGSRYAPNTSSIARRIS
jgi:hypothetical protein